MANLTTDQQKRLLAAEMAFKTYSSRSDQTVDDYITAAKKWLEFIDGGKFDLEKYRREATDA